MYTIAIVGPKGGTGKSTTSENLGVAGTLAGKVVVIVDLDAQTTAMNWRDRRAVDAPTVVSCQVSRLKAVLSEAAANGVDLVILDCPGHNTEAALAAAKAADLVLIPLAPLIKQFESLPALRDLLRIAGDKPAMVIINDAPIQGIRHTHAQEVAKEAGFIVCPVVLYHRTAFFDCDGPGLGVQEYEPNGKAAQEVAQLYKFVSVMLHDHTGTQDEQTKAQLSSRRA